MEEPFSDKEEHKKQIAWRIQSIAFTFVKFRYM